MPRRSTISQFKDIVKNLPKAKGNLQQRAKEKLKEVLFQELKAKGKAQIAPAQQKRKDQAEGKKRQLDALAEGRLQQQNINTTKQPISGTSVRINPQTGNFTLPPALGINPSTFVSTTFQTPTYTNPLKTPFSAISASSAAAQQQAERTQARNLNLGKARAIRNKHMPQHANAPSSWVQMLGYDQSTQTLIAILGEVRLGKSKLYAWRPVDFVIYEVWNQGLAACTTDDPTGANRWWKDKTPSSGAAWHHAGVAAGLAGRRI